MRTPTSPPRKVGSLQELRQLQRVFAGALFRPLTPEWDMQKTWTDGRPTRKAVGEFIKPNDRLSSFERLEIYNRVYWFRIIDSFYDDYPGLRAALGERRFSRLAKAYLIRFPSQSFTLRNLGRKLERFLEEEPHWAEPSHDLAIDLARFEWAQVVAFDGPACPPLGADFLQGADPSQLQLGLQPYISFLSLRYPVDDFILSVKQRDEGRGDASNVVNVQPKASRRKRVPLPKPDPVYVAVHRHQNSLYYKRLSREAFAILTALKKGATLERACMRALRGASPDVDWADQIRRWFANWSELGWFCNSGDARTAARS